MNGVSVVICCFNSEGIVEETLDYLQKQETNVNWEVILVNNASTDQTTRVALKKWGLNPITNLEIINETEPGLTYARKAGIAKAQYDIISFVDDDNFVPANWVSEVANVFRNPEVGILGVTAIGHFDGVPPEWYEKHKHAFATGELYDFSGDVSEIGGVYGAGMSIRKKIYAELSAKKWQPLLTGRIGKVQMGGEDSEICLASKLIGYKIYYAKDLVIQHYIKEDRISEERLVNMTIGFGFADLFLLPYEVAHRSKIGKPQQFDGLRQSVFFNYFSKKVRLLQLYFQKGNMTPLDYKIAKVRIDAFCETILARKTSFIEAFANVDRLLK
ncbi:Glycosyltransferase involved in cell wall bisynthesis [Spirosomataceae bacterium TFI 002]|nr:Glycosyltransferase involved in cell wall bisynthesis [Spirosomataceae bacterium TFI 002]